MKIAARTPKATRAAENGTASGAASRAKQKGRREEILRAAATLFCDRGYEETTIREIGAAAGILSGSLYHHFATKEEILHELIRDFVSELVPKYRAILAKHPKAQDQLRELIGTGLRESLQRPKLFSIIVHERKYFARTPAFSYVNDAFNQTAEIWYGVLEEGVKQGVFRKDLNLRLILRMIMDLAGSTVNWYKPNRTYTLNEVIDAQISLILRGIED